MHRRPKVLVMATRNAHKLREVQALLSPLGVVVQPMPDELPEPPEDQSTFEGNALQKARFVYERIGGLVVADDSGIEVDALGGAPGVHSKRFTPEATDESNNRELLRQLDGAPSRAARYRCALALVAADREPRFAAGVCEGLIGVVPRGQHGFGYDPLFWPLEIPGRTMAELSLMEKNAISHRGRAFANLPTLLGR